MPLFGSENWLYIAIIGLVVGLLARLLKPGRDRMGLILTTLLGIGGALLSVYVGQRFGWYAPGEPAAYLGAVAGAILILLVVAAFRRPRERRIFTSKR